MLIWSNCCSLPIIINSNKNNPSARMCTLKNWKRALIKLQSDCMYPQIPHQSFWSNRGACLKGSVSTKVGEGRGSSKEIRLSPCQGINFYPDSSDKLKVLHLSPLHLACCSFKKDAWCWRHGDSWAVYSFRKSQLASGDEKEQYQFLFRITGEKAEEETVDQAGI